MLPQCPTQNNQDRSMVATRKPWDESNLSPGPNVISSVLPN
jgi:hypothetical protein